MNLCRCSARTIELGPQIPFGQIETHQYAPFLKADVLNNQKAEPFLFNVLGIQHAQRDMYRQIGAALLTTKSEVVDNYALYFKLFCLTFM